MDQQTEHTPGPWFKHKVDNGGGRGGDGYREQYEIAEAHGDQRIIATVRHGWFEWGEYEANAHLISKAWLLPEVEARVRGARDMLREAAKQFRLTIGPDGHAAMADAHANELDAILAKLTEKGK